MSKLLTLGLLVGFLLTGAVPAMAQGQGGIGDPLTLAASGVLVPFFGAGGAVSTIQVSSPVSDNPDTHMFFFDAGCSKTGPSVGIPLTTNDIAFQVITNSIPPAIPQTPILPSQNGLVALARADQTGFSLQPLLPGHPLHVRMYFFLPSNGFSRVIEPIILNTAEFAGLSHWWSALRTAATFYAPQQHPVPAVGDVQTDVFLVCPSADIIGGASALTAFGVGIATNGTTPFFSNSGFPLIWPNFPNAGGQGIRVRIYDTNEVFKRDFTITCACVEQRLNIAVTISPFYADPIEAVGGTYTELTSTPQVGNTRTSFVGYTATYTQGSPLNAFFARMSNGSQLSIDGVLTSTR